MTFAAASGTALAPQVTTKVVDAPLPRPGGDTALIEAFLQSLGRAVRQFHTYPATSRRCVDAVAECSRALAAVEPESIVCVVTPHELLVSGTALGRNTLIEHELARRLHDVRCKALEINRSASVRELSLFCTELAAHGDADASPLNERLHRHGIERIIASDGYQAEIFDVEARLALCSLVDEDRQRREAQRETGRIGHLYPSDKGWLRVDPAAPLEQVTLSGLALLVEEPARLAQMLARVAGSAGVPLSAEAALEERCEDVARLYTALEPVMSRARFGRLAAAVLAMEPPRRRRLLKGKVLPALIDGRAEGELLRELPNADLAEALALLLDVETAAPELLATAIDRLKLTSERRDALAPLLEHHIRAKQAAAVPGARHADSALHERTQQLIRIVNGDATFDGFAAFDLSIDPASEDLIARTGELIRDTNLAEAQLICLTQLVALPTGVETAQRLLHQAPRLLGTLESTEAWTALAERLAALRHCATELADSRPEITAAVATSIQTFFTPGRFARLLILYGADSERRAIANQLIIGAGAHLLGPIVKSLRDGNELAAELVASHAGTFAPLLAASLEDLPPTQRISAIRALGATGPGCEHALGRQLSSHSDAVVRETIQALAAVGSRDAAEIVTRYLHRKGSDAALAAEDAIWQFSPSTTRQCLRSLLRNRQFVICNPELTLRLLARTDRFEPAGLADLLGALTSLRFRVWNPRVARVGRRAAALLKR